MKRPSYFAALSILFFLTCATYVNSLNNGLFLDDLDYIVNNVYIRDWRYLPKMFTQNLIAGAGKTSDYYRPAILMAYTAGYSLWELNPMGYHLMSLIAHCACVGLLYYFLVELIGIWTVAWITALFFGIHPLQSGAVDSAGALGIPLGMFFLLLTCLGYLKDSRLKFLTFFTAIAAFFSKETMVVLPGCIFLIEFCFLSQETSLFARFIRSLKRSLPYLILAGLYVLARFTILNFGGTGNLFKAENIYTQHLSARFFTFMTVFLEFMKLIFWPERLHMEKAAVMPIHISFWAWPVVLGFMIFCGMIVTAVSFIRPLPRQYSLAGSPPLPPRRDGGNFFKVIPFGILWFLFGLVPVSNVLIPISTIMEDTWVYHSIIGLFFIMAYFIFYLYSVSGKGIKILITAMLLIFAGSCMGRTIRQNHIWKDPVLFYEHTLKYAPESGRFRNNLAMAYADQKRYNEAIEQYQLAIQLEDQYSETHHNLANVYMAVERFQDAEREFYKAIEIHPDFFHSYVGLASLYFNFKRQDLAEKILGQLVQNVPGRWEGYYYLGQVYFSKGEKQKATALWQKGLAVDPYNKMLQEALKGS